MNFILEVCNVIIAKLDGQIFIRGHLYDWYQYEPDEESSFIAIEDDDHDKLDKELENALRSHNERSVKSFFTFERKCFYLEKFSELISSHILFYFLASPPPKLVFSFASLRRIP